MINLADLHETIEMIRQLNEYLPKLDLQNLPSRRVALQRQAELENRFLCLNAQVAEFRRLIGSIAAEDLEKEPLHRAKQKIEIARIRPGNIRPTTVSFVADVENVYCFSVQIREDVYHTNWIGDVWFEGDWWAVEARSESPGMFPGGVWRQIKNF